MGSERFRPLVVMAGVALALSLAACAPGKGSDAGSRGETLNGMAASQNVETVTETTDSQITEQQTETEAPVLDTVSEPADTEDINSISIQAGDTVFTATLVRNSSVDALKEMLAEGPVTIEMHDYGNMEKVGNLGKTLPDNDEPITTQAGDLILYQSSAFVIYYDCFLCSAHDSSSNFLFLK